MRRGWKIAGLICVLGLTMLLSACYIPPDEITDNGGGQSGTQVQPFRTLAPTATNTPAPTPYNITPTQDPSGGQGGGIAVVTQKPGTINVNDVWNQKPDATNQPGSTNQPGWMNGLNTKTPSATSGVPGATAAPKATNTPKPTEALLKSGMSGDAVRKLQQQLKDLGYYNGKVDGDFGAGTKEAVKKFQKNNKLSADGVAGQKTLDVLYSNNAKRFTTTQGKESHKTPKPTKKPKATPKRTPRPTATPKIGKHTYLQSGSSGKSVTQLQKRLIDLGWLAGKANGEYNAATEAAVKAFQKKMGLWDDGIAGPDTLKKLYSGSAKRSNTAAASSGTSLKEGMKGNAVRTLQRRLKNLGYYSGSIDGDYGTATVNAVRAFQSDYGLTVDGVAGESTLNKLYNDNAKPQNSSKKKKPNNKANNGHYSTLRQGDSSSAVRNLQQRLKKLGYYSGSVDGSYGQGTMAAVRVFQAQSGLTADGVAGAATQNLLFGTNTNADFSTLHLYDENSRVAAMQATLKELGYFDGKTDGIYGTSTSDAVRAFQIANRITPVDGIAGEKTLKKLYSASAVPEKEANDPYKTLRRGDKGEAVVEMQDVLKQLGYLGDITGVFDRATEKAVRKFQQVNGINVDGAAGSVTLQILYQGNPKRNPGT